jgi:hypothetical protein
MATDPKPLSKIEGSKKLAEKQNELDERIDRFEQSDKFIDNLRSEWDDKEAMLLGRALDSISNKTKSQINDPRMSTIVFERAARVMNREPNGRAYAESEDDMGKNMFMNLLIPHYRKKDNEQYSHLLKLRFTDMYSHVYGSQFGLVPWRVNPKTGFIGPAYNVLKMRDCFPQPGIASPDEWDYFDHRTWVGIDWLLNQDPEFWDMDEIKALAEELKENKDSGDTKSQSTDNSKSFIERTRFPDHELGSAKFPRVEIITEYTGDKWITWTPQRPSAKTSRPHVLRRVVNPYPDGMLPIVVKHSFPLLDSPIGLGEFERGQTLQKAMNSLINLYMDGVKYSIFPPIAVDPNNVVPSSIKWGAGNRWYMNTPGRDVQPVTISPQGLQTFQSTYEFLLSALNNQSGTTSVSGDGNASMGKTPEAVRYVADRESARDEWDRFMMEDTIQQIYERWIKLITHNLDSEVSLRMFGKEAEMIKQRYPDVEEMFKDKVKFSNSKERATVKVSSKDVGGPNENYDWVMETGSTMKASLEDEGEAITDVLKAVIENGQTFEAALNKRGKTLDVAELFLRWLEARRVTAIDRVVKDLTPEAAKAGVKPGTDIGAETVPIDPNGQPVPGAISPEAQAMMAAAAAGADPAMAQVPPAAPAMPMEQPAPQAVPPEMMPPQPQAVPAQVPPEMAAMPMDFRDPQILQFAQELMGGMNGMPPVQ